MLSDNIDTEFKIQTYNKTNGIIRKILEEVYRDTQIILYDIT
jgi:hypothetical protein